MQIKLFNAWILAAPLILVGLYVAVFHRNTARRMADTTGYSRREKAITISASTSPHLFTLLTIFIPLSSNIIVLAAGTVLYTLGLIGFVAGVASYIKADPESPAMQGIYKISRNPMYVTALLSYAGIAVITLNALLMILLIIMILLHHLMILSEERVCAKNFGKQYEQYSAKTPRYLFF